MHIHVTIGIILGVLPLSVLAGEVSLTVTEPTGVARTGWPVTSGIPLAPGVLHHHQASALFSSTGTEIPLQTEVLSRWPDGSIRWLLLDFQVDLAAGQSQKFVLRHGENVRRSPVSDPLQIYHAASHAHRIVPEIITGPLRIVIDPDRFRLLDSIWLDRNEDGEFTGEERLTQPEGAGIVLVTTDGNDIGPIFPWPPRPSNSSDHCGPVCDSKGSTRRTTAKRCSAT